jgi:hypothetical protein
MKKPDIALEAKVIKRFVIEPKQERFLAFLKSEKTRKKFTEVLSQANVFKEELFERIDGEVETAIRELVRSFKNGYIISENREIDQHILDIETALKTALSPWSDTGTLIIFGDAEIVYWEYEGIKNRFISKI